MIIALTKTSSQMQIASHIRAGLLRQLATAPLSEWPQALVQCLDSLAAYGVCHRSTLDEMMRPLVARDPRSAAAFRSRFDRARKDTPSGIGRRRAPSPQVRRVCLFIRAHYDERISLESLAARVGRNTAYMATLFHRQTGMTIHCYLTRVRMRRAATLLRRSEKVEAVMLLVGYRSKKNFYRQFDRAFGVTPGQYKAGHAQRRFRVRASTIEGCVRGAEPLSSPARQIHQHAGGAPGTIEIALSPEPLAPPLLPPPVPDARQSGAALTAALVATPDTRAHAT